MQVGDRQKEFCEFYPSELVTNPAGTMIALEFAPALLTSRSHLLDSMCALGANEAVYGDRTARQVHIISRRAVLGDTLLVGSITGVDGLRTRRADVDVVPGAVGRKRR